MDNQRSKRKSSSTHARAKNTVYHNTNSRSSSTNDSESNSSDAKRSSRAGSARSKNVKAAKGSSLDNSHTEGSSNLVISETPTCQPNSTSLIRKRSLKNSSVP